MLRAFPDHVVRSCEALRGLWDFVTEDDRTDRRKLPADYNRRMLVPSAWETTPGLENYRGKAWYRTLVPGDETHALRLVFGGVSHTANVFLDGQAIGTHYDAFTPFALLVTDATDQEHELVVEVDNAFGEHSALHIPNDYYTYGGITRAVELQYVPQVYIERVWATPARKRDRWDLELRIRLANWAEQPLSRRLAVMLEGDLLDLGEVEVDPGSLIEVAGKLSGLEVDAWSPENPALYALQVLLLEGEEVVDDQIDRIGFREFKTRGKKLLLNGEPVRLRGFNRHEDHPQFGCAIPTEAMVNDLQQMRDMGANLVRTCHYPNDQRFLDLCDETGMMVWEESHARNVPFEAPMFAEQIDTSTREMIDWHHNHPSIVLWGCLNECDSCSKDGRKHHERVIELIRELDPSRPVTFASNKGEDDICLDLVDVVSWNRYDAWYSGGLAEVEPGLAGALKWLHSDTSGAKGKPVILSEFGGGAIYGCRNPNRAKWTEEYQADVLDESLRVYLNHPQVSGAIIWQYCDVRVCTEVAMGRPRTMNNKGVVDEYRRPKLAYEVVKQRMHEAAENDRRP